MSSSSSSSSPPRRKCQRISLKEIEDATANFDDRHALGQGGEAKVYSAQIMLDRSEITRVAVKHLKPNSSGFEDEIQIMETIQHPNIVSLLGYCNDSGQKILIYEYMANGSLADYVQDKQKPTTASSTATAISLSWQQRLNICLGAALGLKHLHAETKEFAKGIIHRDVKPDNILLDPNWVAKISDFGMFKLSRANQIDSAMPTMLKGTGGYYAPEYLKYQHVTRKIDVYAFGVVLFQVLCRKMPWDRGDESYYGMEDEDLGEWARQNVDSKIRGEISDYCLNAFTEIIRKSLSVDPKKRPTMEQVVLTLQNALKRQQLEAATEAMLTPVELILSKELFEEMLQHRDEFYTYDAFLAATKAFREFGTTGDSTMRQREIAVFFALTSAATKADSWSYKPDECGYYYKVNSWNKHGYSFPDAQWPCAPGKEYHGRGPLMISYSYEYGPAGEAIGVDLLNNPDLVAEDAVVSFQTAIWIWMTPRPPKPSCHAVMTGGWTPSEADRAAGRNVGFRLLTNILNHRGWSASQTNVITGFYKRYCDLLRVSYGDIIDFDANQSFLEINSEGWPKREAVRFQARSLSTIH